MKRTIGERVFHVFNIILLTVFAAICFFPFLHVVAKSFSSESAITSGKVSIFPVSFNILAYKAAFLNVGLIDSLKFTIILTILGTFTNLLFTVLAAYPLSKQRLIFRNGFWVFILFTMFFSGGMIPTYLVVKELKLLNTIWALILPGAISTYNMIIMKTYFQTIPESLEESATLDGCNDIKILFKIVIPLSKPVIAALALFYAVGHWNQFMNALLYINDTKKYTLQLRLRQMIPTDPSLLALEGANQNEVPNESLKAASIIFATVPILFVYPWLQKYFVKGILLGSVKA